MDAKVCHVEVDGKVFQVPLRGRLFEQRTHEKRPVAVGDRVQLSLGDADGAIEAVLPRASKLARRAAGEDEREQILAANITLVLIVASIREPIFHPSLVDHILASCERQDLEVMIVMTKLDRDKRDKAPEWLELYRNLGYRVLPTSIHPGQESVEVLEELRGILHTNVTVLAGLSGVGKSSLLNYLIPGLNLRIGSMSRILQGKHTTSHTQLIPLPGGGHVLDTPGVRGFTLFGVAPGELTFYFRELTPLARECGYRDCTHLVEQDCAVRCAVEAGEIAPSRWESYTKMFEELKIDPD